MKSLAALMMLIRSNVDLLSESEIINLINFLDQELRDRKEDKGEGLNDEV